MLALRQVIVGPESPARLVEIQAGRAPRLDYRLVAKHLRADVVQWRPSPAQYRGSKPLRVGRSLLGNLSHAFRTAKTLLPGTLIYTTGETWGLPMGMAATLLARRHFTHVVCVHRVFSPIWLRFLKAWHRLLAIDGYICVTQSQANLLRQALGEESAPIVVVSQGVDGQFFNPDAAPLPESTWKRPYVLAVGTEMRNYVLLFEAARRVRVDFVVQASSAWMAGLREEVVNPPSNVQLMTKRLSYGELRDLYAGAALVLVPLYNTFQAAGITTILEAMAMGKAVVATRSAGLPDVLVHGETGVVVEPDTDALAATLQELLDDPVRRQTLANAGRRTVLKTVTLEHHANQVVEFLLAVAKNRVVAAHPAGQSLPGLRVPLDGGNPGQTLLG